jgi:hypothetical protein
MPAQISFVVDWQIFSLARTWRAKYMGSQNMPADAIAVTVRVTSVLEKLGVPYFISGCIASALFRMVRTTQDSDIIADRKVSGAMFSVC